MLIAVFLVGIILLMLLIIRFKLNPFLALLISAVIIGFGSGLSAEDIADGISSGFGSTMTSIGIVIALGIILGQLLYETGGTEEIANLDRKSTRLNSSH